MIIFLYNPYNGVTRNFMPHLWMFLLQALTPLGHEVLLIDGNAQPMDEDGIARYVREQNIGLVGIGAMTRMIAKAYRMADRSDGGQIAVFFIDDNFAINIKRTKSLLRDIVAADAQVHWVAQISANLLRDEELVDLIAAAGGKWIFIGMESIDPTNLKYVNKGFNKPGEYAAVLERLAQRNVYAITSFIFGMDNDTTGVAERTLKEIRTWPPGLPIFGLMTPLPATPLY